MKTLSDREQQLLQYVKQTILENGYSPSVRDIQRALGFKSTSTVHAYLNRLEMEGYLQKENGKSRTLRVDELQGGEDSVPILGSVHAGIPVLCEENWEGTLPFHAESVGCRREELFALRVLGESMIGIGIMDGDYVVVRRDESARDGDVVVALIGQETTVKTFYREPDRERFRLQPENPAMPPIYTDHLQILGRVVASLRYY